MVAKARALHRCAMQAVQELIDHQGDQRFSVYLFRSNHERLAGLCNLLQNGQQFAHVADLSLMQENIGIFEVCHHLHRFHNEVGAQIAAVELHPLDNFERRLHGLGDKVADGGIVVGRGGTDLGDIFWSLIVLDLFSGASTTSATALSMSRFMAMGLAPAATSLEPSQQMARARIVAVVVPSPASSEVLEATSLTISAPMFSNLFSSSTSLATVIPSLVIFGEPQD